VTSRTIYSVDTVLGMNFIYLFGTRFSCLNFCVFSTSASRLKSAFAGDWLGLLPDVFFKSHTLFCHEFLCFVCSRPFSRRCRDVPWEKPGKISYLHSFLSFQLDIRFISFQLFNLFRLAPYFAKNAPRAAVANSTDC